MEHPEAETWAKEVIIPQNDTLYFMESNAITLFPKSIGFDFGHIAGYVYIRTLDSAMTLDSASIFETVFTTQATAPRGYEPLPNATISIAGRTDKTNWDGGFYISGLRAGNHSITVKHPRLRFPITREINVRRGEITWLNDHENPALYGGIGYYVIVGIDTYPNLNQYNIPGPVEDAKAVYELLFQENRLAGFGSRLINEEATKSKIKAAIQFAVSHARESARKRADNYLVIYFAGNSGKDYLAPFDSYDGSWRNDITDYELESWVRDFPGHVTLIIDGAESQSMADGNVFRPHALRELNYTVISAAQKGQGVNYEPQFGHSVFTYFLLEGLGTRRADWDGDRDITGYELYRYIDGQIKRYYNNYMDSDSHRPSIHEGFYGDTVIFRY